MNKVKVEKCDINLPFDGKLETVWKKISKLNLTTICVNVHEHVDVVCLYGRYLLPDRLS